MSENNFCEWLPEELTEQIFSHLDVQSLCRASMTCKSWNDKIIHIDTLWKPHCLALRAVCKREIDHDQNSGYSWRVSVIFAACTVLNNMVVGRFAPNSTCCLDEVGFHRPNDIQTVLALELKVGLLFFSCRPHYLPSILQHFLDLKCGHFPVNQKESSYFFSLHIIQNPQQTLWLTLSVYTYA